MPAIMERGLYNSITKRIYYETRPPVGRICVVETAFATPLTGPGKRASDKPVPHKRQPAATIETSKGWILTPPLKTPTPRVFLQNKSSCCLPTVHAGWFPYSLRPWKNAQRSSSSWNRTLRSATLFLETEQEPSTVELQELELLNKALKKALKIRTKFLSKANDGPKASEKKPVAHTVIKQQGADRKESVSKSVKMASISRKPASPQKPSAYALKAPYWTDPTVKRPRGTTSARLNGRISKGSGKKLSEGAASAKATGPLKITQVECRKISVAETPRMPSGKPDSPQDAKQSSLLQDSTSGGDFASAGPSCLETEQCLSRESTPRGCTEPQVSTLQEKGSSLKLPLLYRKASSKLARLWEEGRHCQMTPEAAAARDSFVEKLQATFSSPLPSLSLVEMEEELTSLRGVVSLLSRTMETEASLGENPTWEREYESLVALEGLQPVVSECLDKVCQLQGVVESHMQFFPADSAPGEGDSPTTEGPFLQQQRSCGAETFGPPAPLYYSSLQELQQVEALRLQVANLNQQIELQKALESELLPLLEPGPALQGSRASLYRAVYMLLCEGGEAFPALVSEEGLSSSPET